MEKCQKENETKLNMKDSPGGETKRLGPLVGAIDQGSCSTRFTVFVAATGELVTYHQVKDSNLSTIGSKIENGLK